MREFWFRASLRHRGAVPIVIRVKDDDFTSAQIRAWDTGYKHFQTEAGVSLTSMDAVDTIAEGMIHFGTMNGARLYYLNPFGPTRVA